MKIKNHRFSAEIKTGNLAFQDGNREAELLRIQNEIVRKILRGETEGVCMDICGNRVGSWKAKGKVRS